MAGEYFKRNYSAAETSVEKDGVHSVYSDGHGVINHRIPISIFNQFITCITHHSVDLGPRHYIRSHFKEFHSVNNIYYSRVNFHQERDGQFNEIWPNVETVRMKSSWVNGDLQEMLLIQCKNLKRLYLQ